MSKIADRLMKSVIAEDPRDIYYLTGRPLSPDAVVQPMVQEAPLSLPVMDWWLTVTDGGQSFADIFEFKAAYKSGMQKQVFQYAMRAYLLKDLPVRCTTIITSPKRFPRKYKEIEAVVRPGIASVTFDTILLSEKDASIALNSGRPRLLSLVPLMRTTWDQLLEAARRFRADTEDARQWFWRAVGMKYPKVEVDRLFGEVGMTNAIMERLFEEMYPDSVWAEEERAEACQEGEQKGLRREALEMIRRVLSKRFPSIPVPEPRIGLTLDDLHVIHDDLVTAASAAEAAEIAARLR